MNLISKTLTKSSQWDLGGHLFLIVLLSLLSAGCSKSNEVDPVAVKNPEQAASSLEASFKDAPPAVKQNVSAVSDALRKRDYDRAVATLQTVRQAPDINLQQGMAIQNSVILLERELIAGVERGDEKAKQAYQRLKRMNRN